MCIYTVLEGFRDFRGLEFRDFRKALDCMQSVTGIKLSKKVLTLSLKFLDSDFKLKYNRLIKLSNATQLQDLERLEKDQKMIVIGIAVFGLVVCVYRFRMLKNSI